MIDLLHSSESLLGYTIRAWTGVATDEGVGLISLIEVMDRRGLPVCRFEEFLPDALRLGSGLWPRDQEAAAKALERQAMGRARHAVEAASLGDLHGHRYDLTG